MQFRNEFLDAYMRYVDETESPRVFHIWSALSGVAAAMGRRVFLPFAVGDIYPNMYVLLVGPPAVKKSTALNVMRKLLTRTTQIKLAPDDTGGQRQGLVAAMHEDAEKDEFTKDIEIALAASTEGLAGINGHGANGKDVLSNIQVDTRDKHSMYAIASEFNTFIGHNNLDMLTFLIKAWDGDDYRYKLKSSHITLEKPLLNIIGGTTPTAISESIPAAAMGQGFMSRVILVHANEKHARIPRPKLREEFKDALCQVYNIIYTSFEGPMAESNNAAKLLDELYNYNVDITDPRFVYYIDRRHIHLAKLSMVLAASRLDKVIHTKDVEDAHAILQATEISMSDALGEYGLSPLAASKQRLVEFIIAAKVPVSTNVLWAVMHREMKRADFMNCLADLTNAGKTMLVTTNEGPAYAYKAPRRKNSVDDLLDDLTADLGNLDEEKGRETD